MKTKEEWLEESIESLKKAEENFKDATFNFACFVSSFQRYAKKEEKICPN